MAGKLVWRDEKKFQGWGCTDCGFILPNPRAVKSPTEVAYAKEARVAFGAHDCAKYPWKRKAIREDFSQAALRIVREATEKS